MREAAGFTEREAADPRGFVSDVLHKLSQPLTALQCCLELSLLRDRTCEAFRVSVESALQNADRLRQSVWLLRELSETEDPGNTSMPVELRRLLQDLREDFRPVFESAGGRFDISCRPVQVRGNAARLTRAFFYLFDYLLRDSLGASLSVHGERIQRTHRRHVEIRMTFSGGRSAAVSGDDPSDPVSAGAVEIARRTFRAVGGDLTLMDSAAGQSVWIATLPLAARSTAKAARFHPRSGSRRAP